MTANTTHAQTGSIARNNYARSNRVLAGLIVLASLLAALASYLPQGDAVDMTGYTMPAPQYILAIVNGLTVLLIYGALGALGLFLSRKLGLPDICDPAVTNRQRFFIPALAGAAVGIAFIILDLAFAPVNGVGKLIHPPFSTSLVASLLAGINEELLFRLFFVSFWTWIITRLVLRGRGQVIVYWVVAFISALAFSASHLPALMVITGASSLAEISPIVIVEGLLLNGGLSLVAAYFFKRSGYLAAAGVHFWADIVWHVIWGLFV